MNSCYQLNRQRQVLRNVITKLKLPSLKTVVFKGGPPNSRVCSTRNLWVKFPGLTQTQDSEALGEGAGNLCFKKPFG